MRKGDFHQENKKRCSVVLPSQATLVEVMEAEVMEAEVMEAKAAVELMEAKAAVELMEAEVAVVGVVAVRQPPATEKVGKW